MNGHDFTLAGAQLTARADGALWWPEKRLLCVSDLHLGKSNRMARRGGALLPPYETQETLWRLEAAVDDTDPAIVICLGDSFDDLDARTSLDDANLSLIARLQSGRDWIWIEGNHDPGPIGLGGTHRSHIAIGPLTFRHIAEPAPEGEVSGHYHPKAGVPGAGRRPCFVVDHRRLILPAFGAYTGGLDAGHPDLSGLFGARAIAILTGQKAVPLPLSAALRR